MSIMSYSSALDAQGLQAWATRAVAELMQRREEINALNVFPVPDSDTGSNMAHTMESALQQVQRGGDVAEALAVGSVRGARGNSGMVLSQVLRAVSDTTHDSVVDGQVFAESLTLAVQLVTRAISDPVEGTVVTVLRAAAEAAQSALQDSGNDLHGVVQAAVIAARRSLQDTPSQLPALRDAGVVDAGGAGLVILLESLLAEVDGNAQPQPVPVMNQVATQEIEVVFNYAGDVDTLERELAPMGNSLVVARITDGEARFHIHSADAGAVIEHAFASGHVQGLALEALPDVEATSAAVTPEPEPFDGRVIYAAAPTGALADLFSSAGARVVAPGDAITEATSADIFIQNGSLGDPGESRIVATDSYVSGIAALSVCDVDNPDTDAMVSAMRDASRSMRVTLLDEDDPDAVLSAAKELLSQGGEQATILTSLVLDSEQLTQELGVDTLVVSVPGVRTEIGVE